MLLIMLVLSHLVNLVVGIGYLLLLFTGLVYSFSSSVYLDILDYVAYVSVII